MSALIYIETSVPSFYHETRPERDLQSRRDWTRQWWEMPKVDQELVIGLPVISELEETPPPKRENLLALIAQLRILPYVPEIADIVEVYFAHKLMPMEAQGDADHLALASFHNCDMLVTWNCKHLANANKFGHIHRVNALLGLERLRWSPRFSCWKETMKTKHDDGLEWLREIRRKMAAKFNHDPRKAAAYYQKMQRRYAGRLYRRDHEATVK